jgi:hypothetical protein
MPMFMSTVYLEKVPVLCYVREQNSSDKILIFFLQFPKVVPCHNMSFISIVSTKHACNYYCYDFVTNL